MEVDFLLCDEGVLEENYEWGIYRSRGTPLTAVAWPTADGAPGA